jgi:hypothetical protein
MCRRDFIGLLGGTAAAWPLSVFAQKRAAPVVGFLGPWSGSASALACCARAGLGSEGFVDGQNEPPPNEWTPVVGSMSPEVSNGTSTSVIY